MKKERRLLNYLMKKTKTDLETTKDFDGVPIVNTKKSSILQFKDERGKNDNDEFWTFIEIALEFPKNNNLKEEFIKYYDNLF